ncbi:cadmium resistance transporter [Paraburkholderia flava]|uniref:cadmium resistance transporter n=1 Tax=Paraburkholderia flava TaxID=2547393 RepID=UPI00105E550D|nr:cadmium resistance transporter [Paraburkholderia flava]
MILPPASLPSFAAVAVLAVAAYVATNIDNLFVLLAFLADVRDRRSGDTRRIVVGQFIGSAALVGASLAVAALLASVPDRVIGLLGLLPVAVGLGKAWTWLRSRRSPASQPDGQTQPVTQSTSAWTVAGVAIANGSDNLAVYVALYAGRNAVDSTSITLVFAAMTALWCAVAVWLVRHPLLGAPLRRYGAALLPLVLLIVGCSVIVEHDTWRLLSGG